MKNESMVRMSSDGKIDSLRGIPWLEARILPGDLRR